MWSPTHVQVIVQRAKNLRIKGKHGVNDTYVTIQLGKEKYQTSVQQKTLTPEWHEECELMIPNGNTHSITLTVYHRNLMAIDKFLGRVDIPLQELDIYERPKNRFYPLRGKPNKSDGKERGELEVRLAFVVKSVTGSLMDLSKKQHKTNSLPRMVQSVGGSLMNLAGGKDKKFSIGHLKSSLGGKLSDKLPRKKSSLKDAAVIEEQGTELDDDQSIGDGEYSDFDAISTASSSHTGDNPHFVLSHTDTVSEQGVPVTTIQNKISDVTGISAIPAYSSVSESPTHNNHSSSLIENNNVTNTVEVKNGNNQSLSSNTKDVGGKTNYSRSVRQQMNSVVTKEKQNIKQEKRTLEQNFINEQSHLNKLAPKEVLALYEAMTKQELIDLLCKQRNLIEKQQCQINDLESYIDNLLVRVMDTTPRLLQNPYRSRTLQ